MKIMKHDWNKSNEQQLKKPMNSNAENVEQMIGGKTEYRKIVTTIMNKQ